MLVHSAEMPQPSPCSSMKFGYYTAWSVYRPLCKYVGDLAADGAYTHVMYAFGTIGDGGELALCDPYAAFDKGAFEELARLRERGTKIGLSVGGWNYREQFSQLGTESQMCTFTGSVKLFMDRHGFDYLDVDWEFDDPTGAARSCRQFHRLVRQLKAVLGPERFLTVALQCNQSILAALELPLIDGCVSYYHLMGYNFSGSWSPGVQHHSNLLVSDGSSASVDAVVGYLKAVVPAGKVCLAVSGFGVQFSGAQQLGSSFSACRDVSHADLRGLELRSAGGLLASADGSVVSIETRDTLEDKVSYIEANGLAGLTVWDMEAFAHMLG